MRKLLKSSIFKIKKIYITPKVHLHILSTVIFQNWHRIIFDNRLQSHFARWKTITEACQHFPNTAKKPSSLSNRKEKVFPPPQITNFHLLDFGTRETRFPKARKKLLIKVTNAVSQYRRVTISRTWRVKSRSTGNNLNSSQSFSARAFSRDFSALFQGSLPLVLMFDLPEEVMSTISSERASQLMQSLDVFINVKHKPKQSTMSVVIKGIERNASNIYEARKQLLKLEEPRVHAEIPVTYHIPNAASVFQTSASGPSGSGNRERACRWRLF